MLENGTYLRKHNANSILCIVIINYKTNHSLTNSDAELFYLFWFISNKGELDYIWQLLSKFQQKSNNIPKTKHKYKLIGWTHRSCNIAWTIYFSILIPQSLNQSTLWTLTQLNCSKYETLYNKYIVHPNVSSEDILIFQLKFIESSFL